MTRFASLLPTERATFLASAADEAREALRVFRVRYREGDVEAILMLEVQQRAFSAESSALSVERARLEQWVNLNLALGGSWE